MRNIFDEVENYKKPETGMELPWTIDQAQAVEAKKGDDWESPAHVRITFICADPMYKGMAANKRFVIYSENVIKKNDAIKDLKDLDEICGGKLLSYASKGKDIFDTRVLTQALVGNGKNKVIGKLNIYNNNFTISEFWSPVEEEKEFEEKADEYEQQERAAIKDNDDFLDDDFI